MLRHTKRYRFLAVVGAAALVLSACGSQGDEESTSDEVRILVTAPLTGDSAEVGKFITNGAKLAAQYLNDAGGVTSGELEGSKYKISTVDDQQKTEAATTIASKFAADDDLFALMGFTTSGQSQAAGIVLDRYDLGLFSVYGGASFLTEDADNIAVVLASLANFGRVSADFAATELGAKKAGSIGPDDSYMDTFYQGVGDSFDKHGVDWAKKETYTSGKADFSTLLTNIKSIDPDVVMVGSMQRDAGMIAAQMRQTGMDQPFVDFAGEGWGPTFYQTAGSALNKGDFYRLDAAPVFAEEGSLLDKVNSLYRDEYGEEMPTAAMHAFDTVLTIDAAIKAGATSKTDLLQFVPKAEGEGLLGAIGFTEDLVAKERFGTVSQVTGPNPEDRKFRALYTMNGDGTVTRVK